MKSWSFEINLSVIFHIDILHMSFVLCSSIASECRFTRPFSCKFKLCGQQINKFFFFRSANEQQQQKTNVRRSFFKIFLDKWFNCIGSYTGKFREVMTKNRWGGFGRINPSKMGQFPTQIEKEEQKKVFTRVWVEIFSVNSRGVFKCLGAGGKCNPYQNQCSIVLTIQ